MAYKVLERSYINNRIYEEGATIEDSELGDMAPGSNLEKIEEPKARRGGASDA